MLHPCFAFLDYQNKIDHGIIAHKIALKIVWIGEKFVSILGFGNFFPPVQHSCNGPILFHLPAGGSDHLKCPKGLSRLQEAMQFNFEFLSVGSMSLLEVR